MWTSEILKTNYIPRFWVTFASFFFKVHTYHKSGRPLWMFPYEKHMAKKKFNCRHRHTINEIPTIDIKSMLKICILSYTFHILVEEGYKFTHQFIRICSNKFVCVLRFFRIDHADRRKTELRSLIFNVESGIR